MGTYYHHMESRIFIPAEKMAEAQAALIAWDQGETTIQEGPLTHGTPLEQIIRAYRWTPVIDNEGNLTDLWFDEIKDSDNAEILIPLAPYLREGDFVQTAREHERIYRYVVHQGTIYQAHPLWQLEDHPWPVPPEV